MAFWGPYREPVRNVWVLKFGLIACAGIIPLALICAPLRDIPLWWIAVDSSFGVFGAIPLYLALRLTRRLEAAASGAPAGPGPAAPSSARPSPGHSAIGSPAAPW